MPLLDWIAAFFGVELAVPVAFRGAARLRACPTCGAPVGRACRAPNGHSGRPHRARLKVSA